MKGLLKETGFTRSNNDPCLFFGNDMMVVYIDNYIMGCKSNRWSDRMLKTITLTHY